MNLKKIILLLIIICETVCADIVEAADKNVDWLKGIVTAKGNSPLSISENGEIINDETGSKISISTSRNISYEKAKEKAIHQAAITINDINVYSDKKIKDFIITDPEIRLKINQHMYEYSKFREKPSGYLNTSCEIEFKIGYLINALNIQFPENDFPQRDDIEIATKYTSLIVDTRGLKIKPILLPSILNEQGLAVYSRNNITGSIAVKHLAVSYTFTEDEAIKHKKAGPHPFFCTALKSLNGNPVIHDDDVKRILSHKENLTFLKKCRVIFVIDR